MMNKTFADRLRSARMMNGLSLQALADKIGNRISRQALHKYEKGEAQPDSEMIGLLCDALDVRPDFFSREITIELDPVEFRKMSKLTVKEKNRILEICKDVLSRYIEIEEILGIKNRFVNPLKGIKEIGSVEEIEDFSEKVRKNWHLGEEPIANVLELLENNNIKVLEIDADDQFDGLFSFISGRNIPVIVLNSAKLKSVDRKRFTAFHELGHLLLPLTGLHENLAEKYCHRFAGAMLLPKRLLSKELGKKRSKISLQELGLLKQKYGISIQAIIYRCKDLGIISANYMANLFFLIRQLNWKVQEPYEFAGKETSSRFDQLLFRALSEEIISMSKAASLKNQKLAEFRTKSLIPECCISEQYRTDCWY